MLLVYHVNLAPAPPTAGYEVVTAKAKPMDDQDMLDISQVMAYIIGEIDQ